MRQNGPQRRGRGRNSVRRSNNNAPNRNYESNGPEVKIRGTAAHLAEKYTALAQDASVSGDRIAAENYLQHAEHYNRIVAVIAEQAVERQAAEQERRDRNNRNRPRENGDANAAEANNSTSPAAVAAEADSPDNIGADNPAAEAAAEPQSAEVVEISRGEEASEAAPVNAEASEAPKPRRRSPRRRQPKAPVEANADTSEAPVDVPIAEAAENIDTTPAKSDAAA
jgi:hypothetical protein